MKHTRNFLVATPTSGHVNAFMIHVIIVATDVSELFKIAEVQTEYLEATLGLVKCLEISKELMLEWVTVPGCCCCMELLHNHLRDSCSYVRKNTLLATKGGCI